MVFACLVLTVYSTIEEYEQVASAILLKMVINFCINFINFDWFIFIQTGNPDGDLVCNRIPV